MKDLVKKYGKVSAILGGQWGDEGKGKLIDVMAEQYDIVARGTGGANAGHTVYVPDASGENKKFVFHLLPSGMLYPNVIGVIGNGCVVHLPTFFEEIETLNKAGIATEGRVFISDRAHLVFGFHKVIDQFQEEEKGKKKLGTTGRGIGPTYTDKIARMGIRVHDLLDFEKFEKKFKENMESIREYNGEEEIEYYRVLINKVKPYILDTALYLNQAIKEGKKILLEGANATLLDVDHGTYPFVTSSNASIGGLVTGLGISALSMTSAIGIMKAYCTRVGGGPFPTELENDLGEKLRKIGNEFGSTTGRPRRCGWFDAVVAKYSTMINGFTSINLTKLDVLDSFNTIKIATKYLYKGQELPSFPADLNLLSEIEVVYEEMSGWKEDISKVSKIEDLPLNAKKYVERIEELIDCKIDFVGVGVGRNQMALA